MAAELLTRLFLNEIQEQLFAKNNFLMYALNDDAYVNNNSVELPHSGTIPAVTVDRNTWPATPAQRTDAATQYILEELTTDPTHLQRSEELTVNYSKRASILYQHTNKIEEKAADRALYKWAVDLESNSKQIITTGADRTATAPGATGTRKSLGKNDILNALDILNQEDVPAENRKLIVPATMYKDLLGIDEFTRADNFGSSNIPTGVIGSVFGVQVHMRSKVTVYTGDALKAEGAAGAATDQLGAIMWHPDFVRKAVGSKEVFVETGKADYYGDLFSCLVRFGALRARNDFKGVVAITEDFVS